jgi:hypothetical protein
MYITLILLPFLFTDTERIDTFFFFFSRFLSLFFGLEYNTVLNIIKVAPVINEKFGRKSKNMAATMHNKTISNDAVKVINMLSAYFTTTPTTNPPTACMKIKVHTVRE